MLDLIVDVLHEEDALSKQIDNAHCKEIQTERCRGILIVIKMQNMKFVPRCDVREQNSMNVWSECYMTVLNEMG